MSLTLKEVEFEAQQLAPADRARLAEVLLESLQDPAVSEVEAAWEQEIIQRVKAWQDGNAPVYSAAEVLAHARKICR